MEKFCTHCGKEVENLENLNFCPFCGKNLKNEEIKKNLSTTNKIVFLN